MTLSPHLQVIPVPCNRDNYAYLVFSATGEGKSLIVDACEASPILRELSHRGLQPAAILTTHHHLDHVGGNLEIERRFGIPIYGYEGERNRIPGLSMGLTDGEEFTVAGMTGQARYVPGHTQGALAYLFAEIGFTGDTLFCGGCGRLREGSAEQLFDSLTRVIAKLPPQTQLYTGHEYTEANLRFAHGILPRPALFERLTQVQNARRTGRFCASSTVSTELETNLFLRCHLVDVQQAVWQELWDTELLALSELERSQRTFARLRKLKDEA